MQPHASEMANGPLRNVDKLINKELCHRRADSFINKVHTTVIMQTVAVSSAELTPLPQLLWYVLITAQLMWASATATRLFISAPRRCFQVYTLVVWLLFNQVCTSGGEHRSLFKADYSQLEMVPVARQHGSFRLFTNEFRRNYSWFTNSPADRGKELVPGFPPRLVDIQHTHQ